MNVTYELPASNLLKGNLNLHILVHITVRKRLSITRTLSALQRDMRTKY